MNWLSSSFFSNMIAFDENIIVRIVTVCNIKILGSYCMTTGNQRNNLDHPKNCTVKFC